MSLRFPERSSGLLMVIAAGLSVACDQRNPGTRDVVSPGRLDRPVSVQSEIHPGGLPPAAPVKNPFDGDAAGVAEGRRLYAWYNCAGCHFNGGGGIGPALMDAKWIYGGRPENIYDTIVRGRPNGMPAFGGKIPERQVWQIVAYVQTLNPEGPVRTGQGDKEQGEASRPEGGGNR
jgi:cytochrome c oxidase cbb3-type subunit 3